MNTFLHTMISIWICGITISIFSGYYVSATLCFVFLLNTISELFQEKKYQEVMKSLERTKKYINECSDLLGRKNDKDTY